MCRKRMKTHALDRGRLRLLSQQSHNRESRARVESLRRQQGRCWWTCRAGRNVLSDSSIFSSDNRSVKHRFSRFCQFNFLPSCLILRIWVETWKFPEAKILMENLVFSSIYYIVNSLKISILFVSAHSAQYIWEDFLIMENNSNLLENTQTHWDK